MSLLTVASYRLPSSAVMADAANAFLVSLTPEQREKAAFKFGDDERFFWHYIPADDIPKRYNRPRRGLPLKDMEPMQQRLATALLASGLSRTGFIKAETIMSLEDVLRIMENDQAGRRDPSKYFFSIFGEPSTKGTWGYRVEGHHVSLHFTVVDGKVAAAPTFFGTNPAEIREGARKGLRVLGREDDLGHELLAALTPAQKKVAIVADKAYADILTEATRQAALKGQPSGLQSSQLTTAQMKHLTNLLDEYVENVPEDVAQTRRKQIADAGKNLYFAWAGVEEKGGPHYYRVQAPSFLIEYDNTQNGANHVHTVWRDFTGDWGQDLLKMHYQESHK
ncbi:MAG: DUF3500 domain-containing protein [Bryobacteraceae bacterium]